MPQTSALPPAILLMGPTASGKTACALALARVLPVEIISVDSALVYRDMDIGTAKPSRDELAACPHHLIDIVTPEEAYSAAQFCADARRLMGEITARGRVPLLVGGTMLYYKALQEGLADMPPADAQVRAELEEEAARLGWQALHDQLASVDPISAARIHPNDPQRLTRALEVYRVSGLTMTAHRQKQSEQSTKAAASGASQLPYTVAHLAIAPAQRQVLHERIAQRFGQMLEQGFIDEVLALRNRSDLHAGLPSIRAVGYRQVWDYLDGKLHVFDQDWPELPFAHREHIGCTVDYVAGRNRYMGYLISLGIYSFKGIKVGLDCANGASWNIAKSVFDALGADTYVINNQPNGLNINLNAGSTHIEGLQKFVVEKGLDVGFAYDGDADRCLCVDEKGNVISGDHILYIYGRYMKERGKLVTNTVVTTIMSNFGLYKAFDREGIAYVKTAVGDKYVYENMAATGHCLGGEQSGHIIFSKHATTGDGILTSLKVMEVVLEKKQPLDKLASEVEIYPQVLKNVRVKDKKTAQDDEAVQAEVARVTRSLGSDGRILLRQSGTEPVVRVMVEAADEDTARMVAFRVAESVSDQP